jgi:hypothetical protein
MNHFQAHLCFFAGLAGAVAFYACGSSSNGNSGGPPPPTEAGLDHTSSSSSGSSSGGGEASTDSPVNVDAGPLACAELPGSVVYVLADDTQEPLLKVLGRQLRDDANIALAFQLVPSCTLTAALLSGRRIPGATSLFYIPSSSEDPSWKSSDAERTCIAAPSNGTPPDLGISALSPTSCTGLGIPPNGIGLLNGPVQAYTFVVPTAEFASQKSIEAAEAYYAFGDGANNPVTYNGAPEWKDPTQFFLRPAIESSLVASALEVALTPAQMTFSVGDGGPGDGRHLLATSAEVIAGVKGASSAQAIGLIEAAAYDANRNQGVDALAFGAFGQTYGFYPDSTATSFDKQNVRDGHYANWSSTLYIAQVDTNGVPTNSDVKYVTDLVFGVPGATPPSGYAEGGVPIDGLGDVASAGLVPNCAMQVQRSGEGQPLSPFAPAYPCICYFLSKVQGAQLPATCKTCKSFSDCDVDGSLGCLNGYCETPPSQPTTGQPGCAVSDGSNTGILNACTNAAYEQKSNLVVPQSDGGLLPLNP